MFITKRKTYVAYHFTCLIETVIILNPHPNKPNYNLICIRRFCTDPMLITTTINYYCYYYYCYYYYYYCYYYNYY